MGIMLAFDVERLRWVAQALPRELLKEHSAVTCHYCGKEIRMDEAVIRDDIIMCRECAESHPQPAKTKKK
jgi:formylmethanofuran dehydrogenase subunit E